MLIFGYLNNWVLYSEWVQYPILGLYFTHFIVHIYYYTFTFAELLAIFLISLIVKNIKIF